MLLRFYTISSESSVVLSVLDELSHTANARMVLRLKQIRQEEGRRPDPHIRPQHVKERPGAERMPALRTEITRDVEETVLPSPSFWPWTIFCSSFWKKSTVPSADWRKNRRSFGNTPGVWNTKREKKPFPGFLSTAGGPAASKTA